MKMTSKAKWTFLVLVIVQGFHSIEEYIGSLWDVFPPATYLTSLISNDLEHGFIVINISFFVIGILSWLILIRKDHPAAIVVVWIWLIIELINGVGHPSWSIYKGEYTPGVITAPILFVVAVYLTIQLNKSKTMSSKKNNNNLL